MQTQTSVLVERRLIAEGRDRPRRAARCGSAQTPASLSASPSADSRRVEGDVAQAWVLNVERHSRRTSRPRTRRPPADRSSECRRRDVIVDVDADVGDDQEVRVGQRGGGIVLPFAQTVTSGLSGLTLAFTASRVVRDDRRRPKKSDGVPGR